MEEIHSKLQALDENILELQQQVRFCIGNYAYHHKGNEFQILEEQQEMLRQSEIVYKSFLVQMLKWRKRLDQGNKMCNEVDKLLEQTLNGKTMEIYYDDDDDKENRTEQKKEKHVHF